MGRKGNKLLEIVINNEIKLGKRCVSCDILRALDEFHVSKNGTGGRINKCKFCKNKEGYKPSEPIKDYLTKISLGLLRFKLNLTQSDLSAILEISQPVLSRIESEEQKRLMVTKKMKENLLNNLNVTYEEIRNNDFKNLKLLKNKEEKILLYFLQESGGNHIKIGIAKDLNRRIRSIQTSNPFKIILLKAIKGDRKLELKLHKKFEHLRIKGTEWFKANQELVTFIENINDGLSHEEYIKQEN